MRPDQFQHSRQYRIGREEFLREAARLMASLRVIAFYSAQRLNCFGLGGEELQSERLGQMALSASGLHNAWASAGEIADSPVADPAGHRLDHRGFGAAELAARALYISAITPRRAGDIMGLNQSPAVLRQEIAILNLARRDIRGQFELHSAQSRKVDKLKKGRALVVLVQLAADYVIPIIAVPPLCNGRVALALSALARPLRQVNLRPNRMPLYP